MEPLRFNNADMHKEIDELLERYRKSIIEEKRRLQSQDNDGSATPPCRDKENLQPLDDGRCLEALPSVDDWQWKNASLVEQADVKHNQRPLKVRKEDRTRALVDILVNSENPLTRKTDDLSNRNMLRYGEYSPNNPQMRVTAAPYIGIGEYEQRRDLFLQRDRTHYSDHLSQKSEYKVKSILSEYPPTPTSLTKSVQTDIQNIRYALFRHEPPEKELRSGAVNSYFRNSPRAATDHRYFNAAARNVALEPLGMDKPKSILSNRRTGSPRERLLSDLKHSYSPSFMDGFSYQESKVEELERERYKREAYKQELRQQIEEKIQLRALKEEQRRREQELDNRRLEQQLLRMQEEQIMQEQKNHEQARRHSEDLLRRKQELQSWHGFRKHMDSESSVLSLRNTNVASKALSHYSPPVARRNPYSFNIPSTSVFADPPAPTTRYNPTRFDAYHRRDALNRMDSLNTYDTRSRLNAFGRYDSLSRIDSLTRQDTLSRIESLNIHDSLSNVQRRHSATHQDLSMLRKSPKLQRRSSSSRFDDSLPIPVLKAHSPVAKELKNSVPFNSSRHSSDAIRKLEDKWQIPAVQKNIINHGDPSREGQNRSILTQLGAIRMQLQQEQLRMDKTLRKRDITQSKAVDFH